MTLHLIRVILLGFQAVALTARMRVVLEETVVPQFVQKLPNFYGTRRFITTHKLILFTPSHTYVSSIFVFNCVCRYKESVKM